MIPLAVLALLGIGILAARKRADAGGGAGSAAPGKVGAIGDGSSKSSPVPIVDGQPSRDSLKGMWYQDSTGIWYVPTDAEMTAYFKTVSDAAFHNRALPAPPASWGPFTGWHSTTGRVASKVGSVVGGFVGGIAGGPAGAKIGSDVGGYAGSKF